MSATLESRAEITKLARLLECDPGSLAYLELVPPADLRRLRDQATDVMFDADRGALQRMAAASRVIPVPVLAKIAEGIFGPLLCARIAGMIDPSRAVDVAARLTPAFLAEVAVALDPRRATDVIARMPAEQIVAVTRVLLASDEFVTMGRFVGHLSEAALLATIEVAEEAALLQIAFVLEGKERLDHVLALLSYERLTDIVLIAERERLWPEVLDLLNDLGDENRQRFASLAGTLDRAVLEHAILAAAQHSLWRPLIALAGLMDKAGQRRVADLIAAAPSEVVRSMSEAAEQLGLADQLAALTQAAQQH
jgi:hypothetical protein